MEVTAELSDALPHACKADTGGPGIFSETFEGARRHAFAEVADAERDAAIGPRDQDFGAIRMSVAMNVGKGFLNDPEQRDLYLVGEAAQVIGEIRVNLNPAPPGKAFNVPLHG